MSVFEKCSVDGAANSNKQRAILNKLLVTKVVKSIVEHNLLILQQKPEVNLF